MPKECGASLGSAAAAALLECPSSTTASQTVSTNNKYHTVTELIRAIDHYVANRNEYSVNVINKHLQNLSVTLDLTVFDPTHTNTITHDLFASLYELCSKIEPGSSFCWHCVDVLSNACRNPAALHTLVHTYNFVPCLARLLGDQLTVGRKMQLLQLMQNLSCGIKISWQIPHLPYLMSILTEWIESSQDDEIVTLSLGVLVNLCYKNLPAVYTLLRNVNVKRLMRLCATMKGAIKEAHICKLLVILDYMNGEIPIEILIKVANTTFKSIIESFQCRNALTMRQIVDFFDDVSNKYTVFTTNSNSANNFTEHWNNLLQVIDTSSDNNAMETGDNNDDTTTNNNNNYTECLASVFQFSSILIELDFSPATTTESYQILIANALKWIENDVTSSAALNLMTTIAIKVNGSGANCVLEPLIAGLPIFLAIIANSGQNETAAAAPLRWHLVVSGTNNSDRKICGVFHLLKAMLHADRIRADVLRGVSDELFFKFFAPILSGGGGGVDSHDTTTSVGRNSHADNNNICGFSMPVFSVDEIDLYVTGIDLINEFVKYDVNWISLQNNLMNQRHVHLILAQALCTNSKEVRALILEMIKSNKLFPVNIIAEIMTNLSSSSSSSSSSTNTNNSNSICNNRSFVTSSEKCVTNVLLDDLSFPVLSVGQITQIDDVLAKLQRDSDNTAIMELYEHRLASMGRAERITAASLEAASARCTYLQHRIAQLSAELNRYHQLLYHTQQCNGNIVKSNARLADDLKENKARLDVEKGKGRVCASQLKQRDEALAEHVALLEENGRKLKEMTVARDQCEEQIGKMTKFVHKLEENSTKLEKIVQKKEELLKKADSTIERFNLENNELKTILLGKEAELQNHKVELKAVHRELTARKQILDTITKVASSQFPTV